MIYFCCNFVCSFFTRLPGKKLWVLTVPNVQLIYRSPISAIILMRNVFVLSVFVQSITDELIFITSVLFFISSVQTDFSYMVFINQIFRPSVVAHTYEFNQQKELIQIFQFLGNMLKFSQKWDNFFKLYLESIDVDVTNSDVNNSQKFEV